MAKIDISQFNDTQKAALVNNRWDSSSTIFDTVTRTYEINTAIYENRADWMQWIPERRRKFRVQANRIFVNMEAVINSLIANPPGINILPARSGKIAQEFARKLESYLRKKFNDLNFKETMRMGLRNLYFARLLVLKPFWNPLLNDFDFRAVDPRMIRVGKYARKEIDSEFCIEEIEDNLCAIIDRFPSKKEDLLKKYGVTDEAELYIRNPDVKYKEAWIGDYVIFKLDNIILDTIKNPDWDWEGILLTEEEDAQLMGDGTPENPGLEGQQRRDLLQRIKLEQPSRKASQQPVPEKGLIGKGIDAVKNLINPQPETAPVEQMQYKQHFFNYFNTSRKPYIWATILNNENTPIGRTDFITLSSELQRGIDKRKMDIDENCELVNGILKVDSTVMDKANAQRIRFETKGIIWGKGVVAGVQREHGTPLPEFVHQDMLDSRSEIDNIMAASSAFRGERDGQETKAGRLALVQQSYLRLNELVQLVDFVSKECFEWSLQLAKTRYTEYHSAELVNKEGDLENIELIQDDIESGNKVTIIAGKSLPVDDEFKYEQAQEDVKNGYISPVDYLEITNHDNAKDLAKNALLFKLDPFDAVGLTDEEKQKIPPPVPQSTLRETVAFTDLPAAAKVQWLGRMGITVNEQQIVAEGDTAPISINFADLPPDGQVQAGARAGLTLDPNMIVAEKMAENKQVQDEAALKKQSQEHGQLIAEKGTQLSEKALETKAKPK